MNETTFRLYTQTDPAELDAAQLTDALDYMTVKVAVLRSEYEADPTNPDRYCDLKYAVEHHDTLTTAQDEREAASEDAQEQIVGSLMNDLFYAENDSQADTVAQQLADLGWTVEDRETISQTDAEPDEFEDWTVEQLDAEWSRLLNLTMPTLAEKWRLADIEAELNDLDPFSGCLTDDDVMAVINQPGGPFAD